MGVQRNNDEERAAIVERLLEEHRRLGARVPMMKASLRNPDGSDRCAQPERRRGRSDAELRTQREALERQWNEQHGRRKRRKTL